MLDKLRKHPSCYFSTENGVLLKGDCLDIMPELDIKADLCWTDPPYGIANETKITRSRNTQRFGKAKTISHAFGEWDKFTGISSFLEFTFLWIDELDALLRDGAMFCAFCDRDKVNFLSHYLQGKEYKIKGYFAFVKSNPVPQARKVKWQSGWEIACLLQKPNGQLTYNYELGQQADYQILPICSGNERTAHPTQKPLKIVKTFIEYWSNKNDLVIDPFLGSGTTAVACELLDRKWIGIELDEEYCEIAAKRIRDVTLNPVTEITPNIEMQKRGMFIL
jgi:site-specific DNA-methyltransferase (adenine-specific)